MQLDDDQCYRAVLSKDARFDGWFFTAVRSTGIYCRPSCPAITPKRVNVEFHPTAAAAQQRGFRACKRCRPDATPGSPEWNVRADAVGRAMRLIADGFVDREGVSGLARRLSYSERQVNRILTAEVGAGPLALARAQRAQTARMLIETTSMPITDVAFASGFSSVRQFNETVREVYASSPTELRRAKVTTPLSAGSLTVRLACREPFDANALFEFFGMRAVDGVESWDGHTYRRVLRLSGGLAVVAMTAEGGAVRCTLSLANVADTQAAVQRCRRMLDLDADPSSIDDVLSQDPVLAPLVAKRPGLRSPGHPDGNELLVRAILGQQVSVKGARTVAGRLAERYGEALPDSLADPGHGITRAFPTAAALAGADRADLPMPQSRATALTGACATLANGDIVLDAGSDRERTVNQLVGLAGIGPWTASYVAMRALGDPDVFLPTDIGVRNALVALGVPGDPKSAANRAEAWRPWRSYGLHHLWASL